MQLSINQPCSANWNQMSPSQQGRFCQQCQKEVVDFTQLSFSAIQHFFEEAEGEICGRFQQQQLEHFNTLHQPLPTPSIMRKWAAAAVLTAVVALPSFGQGGMHYKPVPPPSTTQLPPSTATSAQQQTSNKEEVILAGRVYSVKEEKGLALATVQVKGTTITAIADSNGYFQLKVPLSEERIYLKFSCSGYSSITHSLIPNKGYYRLVAELEELILLISGALIYSTSDFDYQQKEMKKEHKRKQRAQKRAARKKK